MFTIACCLTGGLGSGLDIVVGGHGTFGSTDAWSTILIIIMIYDLPGGEGRAQGLPVNFLL